MESGCLCFRMIHRIYSMRIFYLLLIFNVGVGATVYPMATYNPATNLTTVSLVLFTITTHFGYQTCLLMWFHDRSVSFSARKLESTLKLSENVVWRRKTFFRKDAFKKRCVFLEDFSGGLPWRDSLPHFSGKVLIS